MEHLKGKLREISMVRYDSQHNPTDSAFGEYREADIRIFENSGYVYVSRQEALVVDELLCNS